MYVITISPLTQAILQRHWINDMLFKCLNVCIHNTQINVMNSCSFVTSTIFMGSILMIK